MQNSQASYANWFRAKYGQIGPLSKKNLIAKKRNNIARKIYGLLLKRETLLKIKEIGELLEMTYHGAGSFIIRFEREVAESMELQKIVDEIKRKLYGK